eukprot:TRINITY_DN19870_c0_g1_i1.p1 TRINITY_DN19870_c0_g1~~TRINITY_DN19870_c0_g1_i1.p1  ORF type:complete len:595 (+),score=135.17 TRINITY_DN19870_c0_g1_i1:69-1853(+)
MAPFDPAAPPADCHWTHHEPEQPWDLTTIFDLGFQPKSAPLLQPPSPARCRDLEASSPSGNFSFGGRDSNDRLLLDLCSALPGPRMAAATMAPDASTVCSSEDDDAASCLGQSPNQSSNSQASVGLILTSRPLQHDGGLTDLEEDDDDSDLDGCRPPPPLALQFGKTPDWYENVNSASQSSASDAHLGFQPARLPAPPGYPAPWELAKSNSPRSPPADYPDVGPAYVRIRRTFVDLDEDLEQDLSQPTLERAQTAPDASGLLSGPLEDDDKDVRFDLAFAPRRGAEQDNYRIPARKVAKDPALFSDSEDDMDDAPPPPMLGLEVLETPDWYDSPQHEQLAAPGALFPGRRAAPHVLCTLPVLAESSVALPEVQRLPPAMMSGMPRGPPTLPPGISGSMPFAPPPTYYAPPPVEEAELPPPPAGEADVEELSSEAAPTMPNSVSVETTDSGKVRVFWALASSKLDSLDKQAVSPSFELDLAGDEGKQPFKLIVHPTPKNDGRRGAGFRKSKGKGWIELKCEAPRKSGSQGIVFRFAVGRDEVRQPTRGVVFHDFAEMGSVCGLPKGQDQWDFRAAVDDHRTFLIILEVMPLGRTA